MQIVLKTSSQQLVTSIHLSHQKIDCCPVCGSTESTFDSYSLPNLYSEKLAGILGVEEEDVLKSFPNYRCDECSLVYKRSWFPKELLGTLFNEVVPDHPKGWDAISGRYTFANFYKELAVYEQAHRDSDVPTMNRFRRALTSMIDCIPGNTHDPLLLSLKTALDSGQTEPFHSQEVKDALLAGMQSAIPFKRFEGFGSPVLWDYLTQKVGPISQYAEIGCPLWGLLRHAKQQQVSVSFVTRSEPNYWGDGCKRNGEQCVAFLHREHAIPVRSWGSMKSDDKQQLIGFFQYLDHLEQPLEFLDELFSNFQHAAVILDHVDEPVYIQHLTGFSTLTMQYLAARYGKQLHTDFEAIRPSANILYLFTDATN
jgi:hypothetical protein